MNTLDLEVFGEDERRIRKSNVRHIFTPHKPITVFITIEQPKLIRNIRV